MARGTPLRCAARVSARYGPVRRAAKAAENKVSLGVSMSAGPALQASEWQAVAGRGEGGGGQPLASHSHTPTQSAALSLRESRGKVSGDTPGSRNHDLRHAAPAVTLAAGWRTRSQSCRCSTFPFPFSTYTPPLPGVFPFSSLPPCCLAPTFCGFKLHIVR